LKIIASAYLTYWEGKSVSGGTERLSLHVKFKDKGKFFKTRLEKRLIDIDSVVNQHLLPDNFLKFSNWEDYYDYVDSIVNDDEFIKGKVEEMVLDYFSRKQKKTYKEVRSAEMARKANHKGDIKVEINIKSN